MTEPKVITLEENDRAKIGIYEIIDWMNREVEFTLDDISESEWIVPICSSHALQRDITGRLISCLVSEGLLTIHNDKTYHVNRNIFKRRSLKPSMVRQ